MHTPGGSARSRPEAFREAGYSITQILIGIAVLGVLASLGVAKLSTFVRQKTLKGEAQGLVGLMQQTRSVGLKKSVPVGVIFDRTRPGLRIFEDLDGNGAWRSGEPVREVPLSRDLAIGPGARPPRQGPHGGAIPRNGLAGSWTTSLRFSGDAMASPSEGALYLHHARLQGWTACLIRPSNAQQFQAFLWDGHAWMAI